MTHISPMYIFITDSRRVFNVTRSANVLLTLSVLALKFHSSALLVMNGISIPPLPAAINPVSTVIDF